MASYQEARVKLTNIQRNKLKSVAENKTGTKSRITKKNLQDEKFPHELFLTTRQKTKITNVFANNMLRDIKLNIAQISKIIQSDGSFGSWLGTLGKKALTNVAICFASDNLPRFVGNITSNATNKFKQKISGKERRKGFTFFISNKDMNHIIKIIKSLEDSDVLIDSVTETVEHDIKNKKVNFFVLC